MRISNWSSDVCSSDLAEDYGMADIATFMVRSPDGRTVPLLSMVDVSINPAATEVERTNRQTTLTIKASLAKDTTMPDARKRSEEHTSELQSLMRISYAVFCLKKKKKK